MSDAVIVDVVRTAGGKRNGSLSGWHPADLAGDLMATLVERNDLDPATIDDVMLGCVSQVGAQALNIARNAAAVCCANRFQSPPCARLQGRCAGQPGGTTHPPSRPGRA